MRFLVFLIIGFILPSMLFSQDLIVKKDGTSMQCKVTSMDSLSVNYSMTKRGKEIVGVIPQTEIKEIKLGVFDKQDETEIALENSKYKGAFAIGLLHGGGSLIGADLEFLLSKEFGVQVGAGVVGFGASMNFHFRQSVRSSYFAIQYWHQGIGESFAQSMIGPSLVYRGKEWFTIQIGLGFRLEKGELLDEKYANTTTMLTYAIGAYIPF